VLTPAKLAFADGVPYSPTYDDLYHSAAGGPAQALHVFLHGNGLPARWAGRERFVILETGFGAGINFLTTWRTWRQDRARCGRLHFVSIEKHPFALPDLRRIHENYELNTEAGELHARWPMLVPGAHRLELDGGKVVLTLFFADIKVTRELRLAADAFYLDGFAPAKNPDMWSPAILRNLSRLAAPGATAATWSVAAEVRKALEQTGFSVEKRPGFGGKREMLVAHHGNQHRKQGQTTFIPKRTATVIGAGLAGAAVCERLCARGWDVTLYERHAAPAQEASGNHAGTFHPIVTPDDSIFARLTRNAFLSSISRWKDLPLVRWDPCGVLQLARDEKEAVSQRRALAELALPPEYAQYATREEASAHAGVALPASGIWFPSGGWVQPRSLVEAQLAACGPRLERRFCREVEQLPAERPVILANSFGACGLYPMPHVRLRRVRGQLTHVPADALEPPHVVVLRGGMVLPPVEGICVLGASFDIDDEDASVRADSHEGNLLRLQAMTGSRIQDNSFTGRVAFRAVAPDRVPIVGRMGEGIYGAFAYGSRGLIWAGLAAELIASQLEDEPLPLEGKLVEAMDPERFARRARLRQP
jgi:tRNA 5-methylaminomethyl-2-thiouridine biosynthesis bifunctional protein